MSKALLVERRRVRRTGRGRGGDPQLDDVADGRPLLVQDRVERGGPDHPVQAARVRPADPLGGRAQPLDGNPGPGVAGIGPQRDPLHAPALEGVPQHQQLRLGVDAGALRPRRQPGVPDLRRIGHRLERIAVRDARHGRPDQRPLPVVEFEEPRRAHDPVVRRAHGGERHRPARRLIGEGARDVLPGGFQAVRDRGEGVGRTVLGAGLGQGRGVVLGEGLQPHGAAVEGDGYGHGSFGPSAVVGGPRAGFAAYGQWSFAPAPDNGRPGALRQRLGRATGRQPGGGQRGAGTDTGRRTDPAG